MNSIEAPRPLNLGEILDRTVQLYRARFLVYLGIAIIPTGLLLILFGSIFLAVAWLGTRTGTAAPSINSATATAIGVVVLALISLPVLAVMAGVSSLSTAALNDAAAGALAGTRPTIRGSFAEAWRRGWQYLWLYVLQALIVWAAPLIVWFVAFSVITALLVGLSRGNAAQAMGALVGLMTFAGLAALAGYALWMLLCVSLAFPGCVVEKISAWQAVRRSFRLSKGTRGRIFVLYLLGYALGIIASTVATVILVIVAALIPALNSPQNAQTFGMAIIFLIYGSSFAMQAFTKPVYAIALMLFYYDQRIRNEGFDIEWMMERAGLVPGGPLAIAGESIPAMNGDARAEPSEMEATPAGSISSAVSAQISTQATETTEAAQPEIGSH